MTKPRPGAAKQWRSKSKGARERVEGLDNALAALELRKAGATYVMIGKQLGLSHEGARGALARGIKFLEESCAEVAEDVRRLELERLDAMILGLWDRARKGDANAVDRVLGIMRQRARYTPGLEIPGALELTGKNGGPIAHSVPEASLLLARFEAIERSTKGTVEALAGETTTTEAAGLVALLTTKELA